MVHLHLGKDRGTRLPDCHGEKERSTFKESARASLVPGGRGTCPPQPPPLFSSVTAAAVVAASPRLTVCGPVRLGVRSEYKYQICFSYNLLSVCPMYGTQHFFKSQSGSMSQKITIHNLQHSLKIVKTMAL